MEIAQLLETQPSQLKLSEVVDAYKALSQIRLLMQKEVDVVESAEKAYKQHLVNSVEKGESKGVYGLLYKAEHKTKRIPKIIGEDEQGNGSAEESWHALHQHIYNTGDFSLLQRRINDKHIMDQFETTGVLPPGVGTMVVSTISVTKI